MKKIILLLSTILILFSTTVLADTTDINITIDGKILEYTDVKSYISEDNRTMIPLRCMGENMGAEVLWNDETKSVTLIKPTITAYLAENPSQEYTNATFQVDMQIGDNLVTYSLKDENGKIISLKNKNMDTVPIIKNDRTFIPARYVAYGLGYDAIWNNDLRTVTCNQTNIQDISFGLFTQIEEKTSEKLVKDILSKMFLYSPECFTPEGYVKLDDYFKGNLEDEEVVKFATTFGFYTSFYEDFFPATLLDNIENKYTSNYGIVLDTKSVKELLAICEEEYFKDNYIEFIEYVRLPNENDLSLLKQFFTDEVIISIIGEFE